MMATKRKILNKEEVNIITISFAVLLVCILGIALVACSQVEAPQPNSAQESEAPRPSPTPAPTTAPAPTPTTAPAPTPTQLPPENTTAPTPTQLPPENTTAPAPTHTENLETRANLWVYLFNENWNPFLEIDVNSGFDIGVYDLTVIIDRRATCNNSVRIFAAITIDSIVSLDRSILPSNRCRPKYPTGRPKNT